MEEKLRPIVIQGAMDIELELLLQKINFEKEEVIDNCKFYFGKLNNYPIILSLTQVGVVNACMATMVAIQRFNPLLIINQGLAGAHVDYIHRNDIVVGEKCININEYITGIKNKNEGSNSLDWEFTSRVKEYDADQGLVDIVNRLKDKIFNLFFGTLGSGDIFNREVDRIEWIHNKANTLCEDNESIAVYQLCNYFNIKCIGFRVITNNEYTQAKEDGATKNRENLDPSTRKLITREHDESPAHVAQKFVLEFVNEVIKKM